MTQIQILFTDITKLQKIIILQMPKFAWLNLNCRFGQYLAFLKGKTFVVVGIFRNSFLFWLLTRILNSDPRLHLFKVGCSPAILDQHPVQFLGYEMGPVNWRVVKPILCEIKCLSMLLTVLQKIDKCVKNASIYMGLPMVGYKVGVNSDRSS